MIFTNTYEVPTALSSPNPFYPLYNFNLVEPRTSAIQLQRRHSRPESTWVRIGFRVCDGLGVLGLCRVLWGYIGQVILVSKGLNGY